ncbi:hypothetical protein KW783_02585, partial [Candidatus Parcubacteria bacterium]|nr:hypothetical protein [Candidatus Parcubacteria bacterium]
MNEIFYNLPRNFLKSFSGKNILLHILAILLTWVIVTTGFDWKYFSGTTHVPRTVIFPAIILGGILPILLPLVLFAFAYTRKNFRLKIIAATLAQAAILGAFISGIYKA